MWAAATSQNRSWSLFERLAFPAPQASYDLSSFPGELIMIPKKDSIQESSYNGKRPHVPCLFLPSQYARFLLICFHGNAEDLGRTREFLCSMRDIFKVHILAVEYPGYGICAGSCSEAGIMSHAYAAMHFATQTLAWPYDSIKLFGRSLGTGPATRLAAEYPDVAGLILVTPFLSIREVVRHQAGILASIFEDCFLNYELAERIDCPTLIIHGPADTLIPISHSMWIYEHLYSQKMMVCPENWHHNSSLLDNARMFVQPMTQFFSLPDYTFSDIELPAWVFPQDPRELPENVMPEFPTLFPKRQLTLLTTRSPKNLVLTTEELSIQSSQVHMSGFIKQSLAAPLSEAVEDLCPDDPSPVADCDRSPEASRTWI